jgi:hypothetical protein
VGQDSVVSMAQKTSQSRNVERDGILIASQPSRRYILPYDNISDVYYFVGCERALVYPTQLSTGNGGYFRNRGSVAESWQSRKVEPRADSIVRACTQFAQRPALSCGVFILQKAD